MLFLRTFGGLSLESSGLPIVGAAAQRGRLAILAVLAVGGDAVSRDRLLGLFWPESDSERARGALKQALYALRRDVAEQELTLGTSELRLNSDCITSDVREFERALAAGNLAEAVAIYSGPFLDGIYIKDAPEFERWVERERKRLAHAFRGALEQLATDAHGRENYQAAIGWWCKLAAADPLSARVARAYMEALAAAGDRDAAIRHGRVYAEMAREEFGAEPDSAVLQLVEQLRANGGANGGSESHASRQAPRGDDRVAHQGDEPPAPAMVSPRRYPRRMALVALSLTLVTAIVISVAVVRHSRAERRLVIVPPFENATGDTTFDALGAMMAAWVTQGLAVTGLVDVVDLRTTLRGMLDTSAHASSPDERMMAMAKTIGATTIVRGAIYMQNESLTVQTRLVRSADGRVLYEGTPIQVARLDAPRLLDVVRQRVMGAFATFLSPQFTPWQHAVSQPPSYAAYQEFVEGLQQLARRRRNPALSHFIAAARQDTGFVQAKIFAFESLGNGPFWTRTFRDSLISVALAQRERLTPYDRAALDRLVAFERVDWEGAYLASRRMAEIAPRSADAAYHLAYDAVSTNRFVDAITALDRVGYRGWMEEGTLFSRLESDAHHYAGDFTTELAGARQEFERGPKDYATCSLQVRSLAALGRETQLDALIRQCLTYPDARDLGEAHLAAGRELSWHGHPDAARRAFERARAWKVTQSASAFDLAQVDLWLGHWSNVVAAVRNELARDSSHVDGAACMWLGVAAAHLGDHETATAMDGHIDRMTKTGEPSREMWRAMIAAALGRRERAMELLHSAIAGGLQAAPRLHARPGLDGLRGYPPFEAMLGGRS